MRPVVRGSSGIVNFCSTYAIQLGLEIEIESTERIRSLAKEYLSVALTRTHHGQVATYAPATHEFYRQRLCSQPVLDLDISARLQEIAIAAIDQREIIGSALVRFTNSMEVIDVNTGVHAETLWTLDFAYISAFENEVRAAYDLPLGNSGTSRANWFAMEYSAPLDLDMRTPYLHLFAHNPMYKLHQITSHTGFVIAAGDERLFESVAHAVDYLEGVVNE